MKKSLLSMLIIASSSSFASQEFDGNYTVTYDCGFISGSGLMGAEPDYEGIDKIFAQKTTVTVGKTKLENPSYNIKMSHQNGKKQACTVAGAGEIDQFHWYISKNECTKIITQPLSKKKFTECGIEINISK